MSSRARPDNPHPTPATLDGEDTGVDFADAVRRLILGYAEQRACVSPAAPDPLGAQLELVRRVRELETRTTELTEALAARESYIAQLEQAVRTLEIGFRRHTSERVSPDQLRLALAELPPEARPAPVEPESGGPPAEGTEAQPAGAPPSPSRPPKKRDPHGRRRPDVIPQVVLEILPPEVVLGGLEHYERIGAEDSSVLGYRRGGPVEVVFRRPKFVERKAKGDPGARPGDAEPGEAESNKPAESVVTVQEHEVAVVPADTSFVHNPFVDGCLVRYRPEGFEPSTEDASEDTVLIAPLAERAVLRGMVDPSLLAHLFLGKLDYHLPFRRQEIEFERLGWPISRANMARWQYQCGELALRLVNALWQEALERPWIGMDATGTAIRGSPEYRRGHTFVLVAPGDAVLYRYTPSYDGATVERLFGGYRGVVVADASANHNILFGPGKAREAGCWCHARKPLVKALDAGEALAAVPLQIIQALFAIEERIALLSPEERLRIRGQESRPLVDSFFAWVDEQRKAVSDGSPLRQGLVYAQNQQGALRAFLDDGLLPLDNNASERALRRMVKGRMNWLCHGSDAHAERACALASLIASAELCGLDPELYLQEVLTVLPSWPARAVLELGPKRWVATRQRLIAEGRLRYIDLARVFGSRLAFRAS